MIKALLLALGLLGLNGLARAADCAGQPYDPAQYVCHNGNFLCPVVAGEPLSYCSGACYSKFMYTCTQNALAQLPRLDSGIPYTLVAQNPTLPAIHNRPVTACGRKWTIAGRTCSYCPVEVVGSACPPGNYTAMVGTGAMDVMVPGGQAFYLDPYWNVAYTAAHSAYIPPGSTVGGIAAYKGGGLVNLNSGGWGWVACPPQASGGGGDSGWLLAAKNETNQDRFKSCTAVNLKIRELPANTIAAWQYT